MISLKKGGNQSLIRMIMFLGFSSLAKADTAKIPPGYATQGVAQSMDQKEVTGPLSSTLCQSPDASTVAIRYIL